MASMTGHMTHPQDLLDIANQRHRELRRQATGYRVGRLYRRRRRPGTDGGAESHRSATRAEE